MTAWYDGANALRAGVESNLQGIESHTEHWLCMAHAPEQAARELTCVVNLKCFRRESDHIREWAQVLYSVVVRDGNLYV